MNDTTIKNNKSDDSLWSGQGNEQSGGDDSGTVKQPVALQQLRKRQETFWNYGATATPTVTPVLTQQPAQPAQPAIDFTSFFANNKWLIIGGVGIVAYFIFSGSLAAQDRTVTSITRYAARKK